ncbi:hypothetical protein [Acinetobacter sp. YT-02]|uniref:hypothetical protein n=1 Tax=Acinetobacter sp. YT-02 TaxID=2018564 RepID=UPI000BD7C2D9|nr:hypothetical protein [Acinetobacter sp. YT-02]PCN59425.1 hypothetical protein CF596_13220 [Acinetobacter sp. YT-02]
MYGLKKRPEESGVIKGAGTGTSDSIQKNVPTGSYVMPADSTQKIGTEQLQKMGSATPVNLSNGEFQLSPDQVHAVGVETLDALKNSTHIPTGQPQLGFKPGQKTPELFFADGGVVRYPTADDIRRAQQNRLAGPQMRDVSGITRDVNRSLPQTTTPNVSNATVQATTQPSAASSPSGFGARAISKIGNAAKGLGKFHGAGSMLGGAAVGFNTPTEQYAERMGLDPNADRGILAETGIRAAGVLSDVGNAASFGILGRRFPDQQRINAENELAAQQKRFSDWNAKKNQPAVNTPRDTENPFDTVPSQETTSQNEKPNAASSNNDPYQIQQNGNSFSYVNPHAAAQARANGVPELATSGFANVKPTHDPKGVANFMANTREMGASDEQINRALAQRELNMGMQGYAGITYPEAPQRTEAQEAERQNVLRMASTPIAGARGLTANQQRTIADLQQGEDNRANQRYTTDANNASNIMQTGMREVAQTGRTAMQEDGQNSRYFAGLAQDAQKMNADLGLRNREMNLTEEKEGFGIRNSARLEKLYEQYDSAKTDQERQSIQQKIERYSGNKGISGKDRYMTVGGGQEWNENAGSMVNRPQRLFDTQTQQYVDSPQGDTSQRAIGTISKVGDKTAVWDGVKWVQQ